MVKVLVKFVSDNGRRVPVRGRRTHTFYGRHVNGDVFMVYPNDAETDNRLVVITP